MASSLRFPWVSFRSPRTLLRSRTVTTTATSLQCPLVDCQQRRAKLKQIKENMLRLHRAAGHTSFENLARLLQRRGCPEWAVELAKGLTCDDCSEVRRQAGPPAASAEPPPSLWEVLGMDVFEIEYKKDGRKHEGEGAVDD